MAALRGELPNRAASLLQEALPSKQRENLGEVYLQTLQLYLRQSSKSFTSFIYNFSSYCKKHPDPARKAYFKSGLKAVVQALENNSSIYTFNAFAVAIEQAGDNVLSVDELDALIKRAIKSTEHLHYRPLQDKTKCWTIGLEWQRPVII
jgi:hypothetical protein